MNPTTQDRAAAVADATTAGETPTTEPVRRPARAARSHGPRRGLRVTIQLVAIAVVLLAWWFLIPALDVQSYLFPSLHDVVMAFRLDFITLPHERGFYTQGTGTYDTLQTLYAALSGYAIGAVCAIVLAVFASEFELLDFIIQPFISALQSLPKIALAPLFLVWFGLGMSGHVALVVSLVVFPVMLNAYAGLKFVPEDYLELAKSLRTARWRTLVLVKLPAALPNLFTGLSVGIVYALLAAIVAEFLSGQSGLGAELVLGQSNSNTPQVFAVLVVLGILGALLNGIVGFIGRKVVFWGGKR
jgi:NitT/TauT family transport system permease protein